MGSVGPPAEAGTIMLTGRVGQVSAEAAGAKNATHATTPRSRRRGFIVSSRAQSRAYSVRPKSAGRNMPAATSIASARISAEISSLRKSLYGSGQSVVHRRAQAIDDLVDLALSHDERRRQQHMVAALAVDRAAHGIDHQAARHRGLLHLRMELSGRIERRLGQAILDQL